jgi:protein-disulfide isomerase
MSPKSKKPSRPAPVASPVQSIQKNRRGLVIAAGAGLVVAAGAAALWALRGGVSGPDAAALRPELVSVHAPTHGDPSAKVHVVEFLDPACETCAAFYPMVQRMVAENPKRIRLSLRHVPLHKGSDQVVAMLEGSRKQDKYWQALEALLASQALWVPNHVAQADVARRIVATVGVDLAQLAFDMQAPEVAERMARDRQDAAALKITQTPEYFVNGRQMASFGRQQLQDLVRDALDRAY